MAGSLLSLTRLEVEHIIYILRSDSGASPDIATLLA